MTSIGEKIYKNPLLFSLMLYNIDSKAFLNSIDSSFWFLITSNYYFITIHLIQFYLNFDREISSIKNFNSNFSPNYSLEKQQYEQKIFEQDSLIKKQKKEQNPQFN